MMLSFKESLELSKMNHEVAKDNKRHVLVNMHPQRFLDLTADKASHADFKRSAQSLDKYNEYTKSGETLNSPFLNIRDGKVIGHEGRHRAAALINAGHSSMPVHLSLKGVEDVPEREVGWEHVPDKIDGQGGIGSSVSKNELTLVRDKVASLK